MNRPTVLLAACMSLLVAPTWATAQSTWEGPTGVFLNPLALTPGDGAAQASIHYLNLEPAGSLTTSGGGYGFGSRWEAGITYAGLAAGGSNTDLGIFHAKYIAIPFKKGAPQVAVGTLLRTATGGDVTHDLYVAATKIVPGKTPVILSATVRETDALGSGLFGKDDAWTTQFGGFLGLQVRPNLILGAEIYDQPEGDPWADLCFRWTVDKRTFLDGGIARINDTFDDQFAVALTHQW